MPGLHPHCGADFEVYSAAQERWLEVSSVSNFETFQSIVSNWYRDENGKTQLCHTLNGSAMALPCFSCITRKSSDPRWN